MELKECGRLTDINEDHKATLSDSTEYMCNQVKSLINENGRTTRMGIDQVAIGSREWKLKEKTCTYHDTNYIIASTYDTIGSTAPHDGPRVDHTRLSTAMKSLLSTTPITVHQPTSQSLVAARRNVQPGQHDLHPHQANLVKVLKLLIIIPTTFAYKMSQDTNPISDKRKQDVMFICDPSIQLTTMLPTTSTLIALEPRKHEETSIENPTTLQRTPSVVEHIASNASVTQHKNQQRRDRDKARRDRLTPQQREEMNARRREARKNKTIEERNASQRISRKNLTEEERQEMNARRRVTRKNKPDEQRQEVNAHRRACRQSVPPEERQALRAQRNADLAARRKIPCAESIAMPRLDAHLF